MFASGECPACAINTSSASSSALASFVFLLLMVSLCFMLPLHTNLRIGSFERAVADLALVCDELLLSLPHERPSMRSPWHSDEIAADLACGQPPREGAVDARRMDRCSANEEARGY